MLVSVVVPTKDSGKLIGNCLEAVRAQTYKNTEIIVSDGGSIDDTLRIAKKYKVKIINNPDILAEPGVYRGMKAARGDLVIALAVDNLFKDKDAIETIAKVFENKKIYAAFPKHESSKEDSLYTKYMNTFTDPFNHFLYGYAANARTFKKIYKTLEHNLIYDIYDYKSSNSFPILAIAQGFTVRKNFADQRVNKMDDMEPIFELIKQGKQIAYLHSISLYHHTTRDLNHFVKKQRWATRNYLLNKQYGIKVREKTFTKWQKVKRVIWPIYAFSIILPFFRAMYGLIRDKEIIWLWHPYMCFLSAYGSFSELVLYKLCYNRDVSRQ